MHKQSRLIPEKRATLALLIATLRESALESNAMHTVLAIYFLFYAVSATSNNLAFGCLLASILCIVNVVCAFSQPLSEHQKKPKIMYRNGYVYLIKTLTDETLYKIGRTNNPSRRIRKFNVVMPFAIEAVCIIKTDNMYALETSLHRRFATQRLDGEFFRLTLEDFQYIKSLGESTK